VIGKAFVPEGLVKIARQFTAWDAKKRGQSQPDGLIWSVQSSIPRTSRSSFLPASYFESPSTEWTGEAAALGALSHGRVRADHAASLATTAKFAGFTAEDRETLALIETCFVANDAFAFFAIVSAAERGGNRPGVFVYIVHYIEPSGRQPFGVHKGNCRNSNPRAAPDQPNILGSTETLATIGRAVGEGWAWLQNRTYGTNRTYTKPAGRPIGARPATRSCILAPGS
jgi:hypothetical protein